MTTKPLLMGDLDGHIKRYTAIRKYTRYTLEKARNIRSPEWIKRHETYISQLTEYISILRACKREMEFISKYGPRK